MLLAGDIPQLQPHGRAADRHRLERKVHADGRAVVLRERVVHVAAAPLLARHQLTLQDFPAVGPCPHTHRLMMLVLPVAASPSTSTLMTASCAAFARLGCSVIAPVARIRLKKMPGSLLRDFSRKNALSPDRVTDHQAEAEQWTP